MTPPTAGEGGSVADHQHADAPLYPFRPNWLVFIEEWVRGTLRDPLQHFARRVRRHCSVCGFHGLFIRSGRPDVRCPNCSSRERDRLVGRYLLRNKIDVRGKHVLHLSPERCFWRQWRNAPNYVGGDVKKSHVADTYVDITQIPFPDEHFDFVICNHILEHVVDDRQGMRECCRVLKPDGLAIFSVPLFESGRDTFEPPPGMSKREVERICGWDHKRIYGFDFLDRLHEAGFETSEITCTPEEAARYRLTRDRIGQQSAHRVFVARRSNSVPAEESVSDVRPSNGKLPPGRGAYREEHPGRPGPAVL